MLKRPFALLVALCAILVSTASAGGFDNKPTSVSLDPRPDAPTLSAEEALLDDAEEFSKLHGVSRDEALRRLDMQMNVVPAFENAVAAGEAARYAGLIIENKPTFRVAVLLTSGTVAELTRYTSDSRLRNMVEVRRVARTYAELKSAQLRLRSLSSVAFQSDIDIAASKVYVDVAAATPAEVDVKAGALRAEAARQGFGLPDWVVVKGVPSLASRALDIFGGLDLSTICTSGFSVTGPGGSGGVTTAGHCDNSLIYAGYPLTFKGQHYSGAFDIQWHSRTNTNFPAKIYRGQGVYGAMS